MNYYNLRIEQWEHEEKLERDRQEFEQDLEDERQRFNKEMEQERQAHADELLKEQERLRKLAEREALSVCLAADGGKLLGTYEGELSDGLASGEGKFFFDNGDRYIGRFLGGKFHGQGKMIRRDGEVRYEGEWEVGYFHGTGTYYYSVYDVKKRNSYQGSFFRGLRQGKGVLLWSDGTRYEGEFAQNEMHGHGVMIWPCGDRYEGQFANGTRNGYGKYTSAEGYCYEGQWKDGKREGAGKTTYPDGWSAECVWKNDTPYTGETRQYADDGKTLLYEGDIVEGKKQGRGVIYCTINGRECVFKGEICNGRWQVGTLYYANGNRWYEGDWKGTSSYGKGVEYCEDGNILRQGTFENNELHGEDCIQNHYVDGELYATKKGVFANGKLVKGVCQEGEYRAEGKFDEKGIFINGKLYQNDSLLLSGDMTGGEISFYKKDKRYTCVKVVTQSATYLCSSGNDALLVLILEDPEFGLLHVYEQKQCTIEGNLAVWSDDLHCEKYALDGSFYFTTQLSDGYGELHFDETKMPKSQNLYALPYSNLHHLILKGHFVDNKPVGECQLSDNARTPATKETAMYVDGIKEGEFTWTITDSNGRQMTIRGAYQQGKMKRFATIHYPDGAVYKGDINTQGERHGLGLLSAYQEHRELSIRMYGVWDNSTCIRKMSSIEFLLRKIIHGDGFAQNN